MVNKIWILTIFPDYFRPFLEMGVSARAFSSEKFELHLVDIRQYSFDKYKGVDDAPFGGGPGMVMRADILQNALLHGVITPGGYQRSQLHVICPSPRGARWNTAAAKKLASDFWRGQDQDLVFICGRYEGIDERFLELYVDQEISIGDYILTGGELAVLSILDSALRFVPGVLGNEQSLDTESFENSLLEGPQYTRPRIFEGKEVPEILLSGHHANIEQYKEQQRLQITKRFRPDLLKKDKDSDE